MKDELSRRIWFPEYEPETDGPEIDGPEIDGPDLIEHSAPIRKEIDSILTDLLRQIRIHGVIKGRLL